MDKTDKILLRMLSEDSGCTATRMAAEVHMSIPAVNKRIAALKKDGVIECYSVRLNSEKIGKPVLGYALLVLDHYAAVDDLVAYVKTEPDIVEFHAITGEYDYIAKIYAKDIRSFEDTLIRLKKQRGVAKSNTLFSLFEYKNMLGPLPD